VSKEAGLGLVGRHRQVRLVAHARQQLQEGQPCVHADPRQRGKTKDRHGAGSPGHGLPAPFQEQEGPQVGPEQLHAQGQPKGDSSHCRFVAPVAVPGQDQQTQHHQVNLPLVQLLVQRLEQQGEGDEGRRPWSS